MKKMKIATNAKSLNNFGYQLIFNEEFQVIGINFVCDKQILKKERFNQPVCVTSQKQEYKLAQRVIENLFKNK